MTEQSKYFSKYNGIDYRGILGDLEDMNSRAYIHQNDVMYNKWGEISIFRVEVLEFGYYIRALLYS